MPLAGALKDKNSVHNTDSQRGSQEKIREEGSRLPLAHRVESALTSSKTVAKMSALSR